MSTALDPVIYEVKNNLVSSFSFAAISIVAYYVTAEVVQSFWIYRGEGIAWWRAIGHALVYNYRRVRIQLALSFASFLFGEYTTSLWTFAVRYAENRGYAQGWMGDEPFVYVPIAGGAVQVVAAVCLVRILAPDEWGHRGWIAAALYALVWSSVWMLWR